jgi:uncharacterized Zn finger protein
MDKASYEIGFLNHSAGFECTQCEAVDFEVVDKISVLSTLHPGNEAAVIMRCNRCGEIFWNHESTDEYLEYLQLEIGDTGVQRTENAVV